LCRVVWKLPKQVLHSLTINTMHAVINAHSPENAVVLVGKKGDRLQFIRKRTGFEGWIWCTDAGGVSAWVPEAWTSIEGRHCSLTRDYQSRELDVSIGEHVRVIEFVSGWAWVRNKNGEYGWIPQNCLSD
jgi:SH3-like domain-containing protein